MKITEKREMNSTHIHLLYNDYTVTLRNKNGYTVVVTGICCFNATEAEEQAIFALCESGFAEEFYETIKIEIV